jgi:hypothetical protein
MAKGYVYFIISPINGMVKVGFTDDHPDVRLRRIRATSPVPLEPMGVLPGGLDVERQIHHRFAYLHSHGEWFRLGAAMAAFIRANAQPWTPRGPKFRRAIPRPSADGSRVAFKQTSQRRGGMRAAVERACDEVRRFSDQHGVPGGWHPIGWPWPRTGERVDWMTIDGEITAGGTFVYGGRQCLGGDGAVLPFAPYYWRPALQPAD